MDVFVSNRLEVLYAHFLENLTIVPFNSLTIVVPSPALKEWLTFSLAKDKNVLLGVEIILIEEALFPLNLKEKPPSFLDLALKIESKLEGIEEIKKFVRSPARKFALAERLARLFQKYHRNISRMKSEWKKGWQAELYQQIFKEWKTGWECVEPQNYKLFGVSYLSPLEKRVFKDSQVWLFSPCLHYWEDQLSNKEQAQLVRSFVEKGINDTQIVALEEALIPINPLLAAWGKLGKHVSLLDEHENRLYTAPLKAVETYEEEPGDTFAFDHPMSRLDYLQCDILYGKKSQPLQIDDDSIIFHEYASLKKEMEGLRNHLLYFFKAGLQPKDVLILVPSIEKVKPFLPLAFKSDIPFFIGEQTVVNESKELFIQFWDWVIKGGTKLAFFDWLKASKLMELDSIRKIEERLYFDSGFVNFKKALDALKEEVKLGKLDASEIEPLREFLVLFNKIETLILPATMQKNLNIQSWGTIFKGSLFEKEAPLILESIVRLENTTVSDSFAFHSAYQHLLKIIENKEKELFASNLNSVRISSLYPMRLVPTEAVILIGFSEEEFPRKEKVDPLDESLPFTDEPMPTKTQLDRFLFLEAIFQARKYFWLSCSSHPSPLSLELKEYLDQVFPTVPHYKHSGSRLDKIKPSEWTEADFKITYKRPALLSVKDLREVFENPIKAYLETLNIRVSRIKEEPTPLIPDGLDRYLFEKKYALKKEHRLQMEGRFTDVWVEKKVEDLYGLQGERIQLDPPLEVDETRIYGTLEPVCEAGIILTKRDSAARIKEIASILVWGLVNDCAPAFRQRDKKDTKLSINAEQGLKIVLRHYDLVKEQLFPVMPDWLSIVAKGDVEKLKDVFEEEDNLEARFIIDRGLKAEAVIEKWQPYASELLLLIGEDK